MKYCLSTTTSHTVAKTYGCVTDINALLAGEGYLSDIPLFINSEVVLNLDEAEALYSISIGRKEKNKSMDLAFGIVYPNSSKTQMLMVELKFNMTDFYGLRKKDLEDKVAGSSLILSNQPTICKRYIFVFQTQHLQEAISRLYRMIPKIDSSYIALDINLLKEKYF